ncbi:hypothetical protein HKD37_02G003630 [Glycine soja]
MKHVYKTSFIVALNAFPFATISVIVTVPPRRQHARVIYEALFEVEERFSLTLYALLLETQLNPRMDPAA